jgi:cation transport ATPase
MTFCPRCGASLKVETTAKPAAPSQPSYQRNEKAEKQEKGEKQEKNQSHEKGEKHEKGEFGFIGWLIGGLILIFMGAMYFINMQYRWVNTAMGWALFLLVIGVVIIVVGVYVSMNARKRHPSPS